LSVVLDDLSNFVRLNNYSLMNEAEKRRETWPEQVARVMGMHREFYGEKLEPISELVQLAENKLLAQEVLGSQRALQYGGKPMLVKHARGYNCVSENTRFVTSKGVKSFNDFKDGDEIVVLTHTGAWKKAVVHSYGEQELFRLLFARGPAHHEVIATRDHRWILEDGSITEHIEVGQKILAAPKVFQEFDFHGATDEERLWWAYGMVYGDGTVVQNGDCGEELKSQIRLCGAKARFLDRFVGLGFNYTTPPSYNGEPLVRVKGYAKTIPELTTGNEAIVRAFVAGYLDADGHINKDPNGFSRFTGIQASDYEAIEFIRKAFPLAGVYIISETEVHRNTNFGRVDAVWFAITQGQKDAPQTPKFTLKAIEPVGVETVWCLNVEDDHSFVLPFGAATSNCWGTLLNRPRFFQEMFWIQLAGGGTGFNAMRQHVNRLPTIERPSGPEVTYVIPDTIEGWADSAGVLFSSYFTSDQPFPEYAGRIVKFDGSKIRSKGSKLSSGSLAPGPEPLLYALEAVRNYLNMICEQVDRMRVIHAFDCSMFLADAVLSGGVRRSASWMGFDEDDEEMMLAKATPGWRQAHPQRQRANISVVRLRDATTWEDFKRQIEFTRQNGEPGMTFVTHPNQSLNPCVEAMFWALLELAMRDLVSLKVAPPVLPAGSQSGVMMDPVAGTVSYTGWQACNLTTMLLTTVKDELDFYERCRASATLGSLQSGYTDFEYLGEATERIVRQEALLGVSMTGMMDRPEIAFNPDILRRGAEVVKETNEIVTEALGHNPASRTTLLKPEGSGSLLVKTFAAGVNPRKHRKGIRYVEANATQPAFQHFAKYNPGHVAPPQPWDHNKDRRYMAFPYRSPEGAVVEADLTAVEMLEHIHIVQKNWIEPGQRPERCARPFLHHNVSNTVGVKEHEWDDAMKFVFDRRHDFVGVSFFPEGGDKLFYLAPFTEVKEWETLDALYGRDAVKYAHGLIERAPEGMNIWDVVDAIVKDEGAPLPTSGKWEGQFIDLALHLGRRAPAELIHADLALAAELVKEVELAMRWDLLNDTYVPVPWEEMREEEDTIDHLQISACANGECLIDWSSMGPKKD
jgi:ribonucleoside-triphosphate reductase